MPKEITLASMQEMVRRKEGRLGEKQQLLRLVSAVGRLAENIDDEKRIEDALSDVLYNTLALANTYGIDMEACMADSVPGAQQGKRAARSLDFRPL